MKTIVISLFIILSCPQLSFSQTTKTDSISNFIAAKLARAFAAEVIMDIDTTVYTEHTGNMYLAGENSSLIMSIVAPQTFSKAKEQLQSRTERKDFDVKEQGEFEVNGSR
jgi:hypothetical protein